MKWVSWAEDGKERVIRERTDGISVQRKQRRKPRIVSGGGTTWEVQIPKGGISVERSCS